MYGRWNGIALSSGYNSPSCQQYCRWVSGEPNHVGCGDGSTELYPIIIGSQWSSTRGWDDVWLTNCSNITHKLQDTQYMSYCVACERSHCLVSDCPDPANMINPTGYWPSSCSCSYRACRQSDCSDPANMVVSGTYPSYSCAWRACTLADCPRPGMVRVRGHYTACHCDTVSESLSLTTLVTGSFNATESEEVSVTLSLAHTLSLTTTASTSCSPTLSPLTASHSNTPTHSDSHTTIVTRSATLTPSTVVTLSTSPSIISATPSATESGLVSGTVSASQSHSSTGSEAPSPSDFSRSTSRTSTITETGTGSPSRSPTGLTASSTNTLEQSVSATYVANTTLVADLIADLPLFELTLSEGERCAGINRTVPLHASPALWLLLINAIHRWEMPMRVPITSADPEIGPVGVTGNTHGFYLAVPNVTVLMFNASELSLNLTMMPSYSINVGERLLLYTTMRALLRVVMITDHTDVDTPRLVGIVDVVADVRQVAALRWP